MSIPVSGYPAIPGNSLAIETIGNPVTRVVYAAANPGERWLTWSPELSGLMGREARIVANDGAVGPGGWLALGPPYFMSNAEKTIGELISNVARFGGLVILTGIAVFCLQTRREEE